MHWITPTAGAILFGSFHALVVALPLVSTGGRGEGQAFAVMIFDLPLVALLSLFKAGKSLLYNGPPLAYVAVFAVVGTTSAFMRRQPGRKLSIAGNWSTARGSAARR